LDSLWGAGTDADETSGESPFGKFAPLLQVVQTSPPGDSVVDDKGSPRLGASLIRFIYRSGLEPDVGETLTIEATHAPITLTVINNDAFLWKRPPRSYAFWGKRPALVCPALVKAYRQVGSPLAEQLAWIVAELVEVAEERRSGTAPPSLAGSRLSDITTADVPMLGTGELGDVAQFG